MTSESRPRTTRAGDQTIDVDEGLAYVIQAVNALVPLGKDAALDRVASYARDHQTAGDGSGLFWVLRVLFDVPPDRGNPLVRLGQPTIPPPPDPQKLPRFPIVIVRDVPFLAIRGYLLAGLPESIDVHVSYYRAYGTIRSAPLTPPLPPDGLEGEFLQQWKAAYGDAYVTPALATVREQIARLGAVRAA